MATAPDLGRGVTTLGRRSSDMGSSRILPLLSAARSVPVKKTSQSNHTRTTALSNSMKPSHAHGATQDGQVMMQRFDRMWSTGEGNGKPLQISLKAVYARLLSMVTVFLNILWDSDLNVFFKIK